MSRLILAALMILLSFASTAQANDIERHITGYGKNTKEAINDALIRAVEQQFGIKLNTKTLASIIANKNEDGISITDHTATLSERHSKGNITSYEVLDKRCTFLVFGDCEVDLSVHFSNYQAPGTVNSNRYRLAVLPFKGKLPILNHRVSEQIQEHLVQSGKFTVLDREQKDLYKKERELLESNNASIDEKARLAKVLGLDYLVVGIIKDAGVQRWTKSIELTGEQKRYAKTRAMIRYEVIAVATREIVWANTVSLQQNGNQLDRVAVTLARKIADQTLNKLYPLRIVAINNGQIILNQGGKTLKPGELFKVFATGEEVIDPYTHEVLGQTEQGIAVVQVIKVDPNMAYAQILEGNINQIAPQQIVRKFTPTQPKAKSKVQAPVKQQVQVQHEGGVIL